jgi:hypothetical protein
MVIDQPRLADAGRDGDHGSGVDVVDGIDSSLGDESDVVDSVDSGGFEQSSHLGGNYFGIAFARW